MLCNHKTKVPIDYFYGGGWSRGDKVWYNDPNQGGQRIEGRLRMCIDCGQVFVDRLNTIDKD